jgi:roadblock/LC7 domain-containing protein
VRTLADLSDAEMAALAKLLNVEPIKLEEQRAAMSAETAAVDAAAAAAVAVVEEVAEVSPYAEETGEEPWYDEANWAAADKKKVNAAFTKREKAELASSAAYSIWSEAFENAVGKSRDKYKAEGWKPEPVKDADTATEAAAEAI